MPQAFSQNPAPDGETAVTGLVHSVESCGTVDGPGIRFVLFLSGCSLRCRYCHNPDTSYVRRGRCRSVADVLEEIARYRDFLLAAGGGVTLSGGDPLSSRICENRTERMQETGAAHLPGHLRPSGRERG